MRQEAEDEAQQMLEDSLDAAQDMHSEELRALKHQLHKQARGGLQIRQREEVTPALPLNATVTRSCAARTAQRAVCRHVSL